MPKGQANRVACASYGCAQVAQKYIISFGNKL